jgi:hypothetical protein
MRHRISSPVILLLLGAACSRAESPPADSIATVLPSDSAAPSSSVFARGATEMAMRGLNATLGAGFVSRELTMEDIRQLGRAAENVRRLKATDPELGARIDGQTDPGLSGVRATIEREPRMREAIERAGLTPDEYIATTGSVAQAMFVAAMMKPNAPARLTELPAGVPRSNVTLVMEHEAEVRRALSGSP